MRFINESLALQFGFDFLSEAAGIRLFENAGWKSEPQIVFRVRLGMDTTILNTKFERIGARLKILQRSTRRMRTSGLVSLDIGTDRLGEYFEITPQVGSAPVVELIDVQPTDRHLLLLVREDQADHVIVATMHDHRVWF